MANQKDNLEALAKLGITASESKVEGILPLRGDESAKEVADILKAAKAATKESGSSSNQSDEQADTEGTVLVWVKGRTYINEKERIDGGFYRLALPLPDRLTKSSSDVVEVFANGIPPRKLAEVAKFCGVSHPEDYKTDDELLAKIVTSELKPF